MLGYSRLLWARFVLHQDLQTVLRCHLAAFAALEGVPRQILYDRMKTAVSGEDAEGHIVYNRTLVDFARHHGYHPKACRPHRPKTKGKVERPYRYIREDFFLARSFQNLDDLNAQLRHCSTPSPTRASTPPPAGSSPWPSPRSSRSSSRCHGCRSARFSGSNGAWPPGWGTGPQPRSGGQAHAGMVSIGGNYYSVPDTTRRHILEVQALADEIQIFQAGQLIARHPVLEGRNQRRVAPGHRKAPAWAPRRHAEGEEPILIGRAGEIVARRSLDFYEAVALRLIGTERPS